MGLDNPLHIAFLLVILLLVFGARRLPEIGRSLGSGMREFKDSISGDSHKSSLPAAHEQQAQHAPVQAPTAQAPAPMPAPAPADAQVPQPDPAAPPAPEPQLRS